MYYLLRRRSSKGYLVRHPATVRSNWKLPFVYGACLRRFSVTHKISTPLARRLQEILYGPESLFPRLSCRLPTAPDIQGKVWPTTLLYLIALSGIHQPVTYCHWPSPQLPCSFVGF